MIKNLFQLKNTLSKCQGSWAWVGQRGIDAFTVLDFIPVDAGFCCDFGEEYPRLWARESLFSVEKDRGSRENWGKQDLEKLWQLELFSRLGVKTPTTFGCRLDETSFVKAGDILDGPFVVQPPVGSSGENTYFVNDEVDFDRVRDVFGSDQRVKLSKYLPVPSLNGHCIVLRTREGLRSIAVCPSVQVVGIPGCTSRAETYCGNDFSAAGMVSKSIREEICTIMEKIGLFMGSKGFLGLFGMDFLLHGDRVLALEINPRFQGSTMLLSLLQVDRPWARDGPTSWKTCGSGSGTA